MTLKVVKAVRRTISSACKKNLQVCIVGAGPAGFYAAMHLSKNVQNVNLDIIEKLPVPFGLIRYGVAPDHPEVKNVINQFTKVAKQPNVNFYGNISLGKDIHLRQLREHYDAVLLTYGAEKDRLLGIENEDAQNVISARNFVGWYNGHPSEQNLKIDLSSKTAAILGQGNVALDVARILYTPIDDLRKTDITECALSSLAESKVRELYLVGRRGPLQVAFTIKELREQLNLKNCQTVWRENDFDNIEDTVPHLPRPRKRLTELMLKSFKQGNVLDDCSKYKIFKPIFFRSPKKFLINTDKQVTGVLLACNKLHGDNWVTQKCLATDDTEILNCGLVFRSIGYTSVQADNELSFDNGVVPNDKGCVLDDNSEDKLAKLYVAGWLGTGPVGVILHTMGNAFQVAKVMCDDLKNVKHDKRDGFSAISRIMNSDQIVDWNGWERINKYEIEQGQSKGKPREKICNVNKMIEVAKCNDMLIE
ncbi:hypothetical protein K1T71_003197 [Dendrolimus kikuchii]|uniref:Uncharacterized protein n=1 Tax=Dendrolimus kikuchii TaxID=765133 RepID=A0ACC1DB64_9NEOP|nr:hypothetical protein K1T71_003197 [Dendrolimus kikuchii]